MTAIGEVMKGLEIPGSEEPPESVLRAANEAASIDEGGVWRKLRHKWVIGLIAISLVGVPTAYALSSQDEPHADLTSASLEQRRELLTECVDSGPGSMSAGCAATFGEVRECLRTAGPEDPSCASAVPNLTVVESIPLNDLQEARTALRPFGSKLGSILESPGATANARSDPLRPQGSRAAEIRPDR